MNSIKKKKILLITGDNICYNVLNEFAHLLSDELKKRDFDPQLLDLTYVNENILHNIKEEGYCAIIGFQTNLFTLKISENKYIGNILDIPMYNILVDSPASRLHYFEGNIDKLTILYHDYEYLNFVKKYYPKVKVEFFPLGGKSLFEKVKWEEGRIYDCTFMGTYTDYREILRKATTERTDYANIILEYFQFLIESPWYSHEEGIELFLEKINLELPSEAILMLYGVLYISVRAAIAYYREKTIKMLLDSGIRIDVFSRSWEKSTFANNPMLIIHDEVPYSKTIEYYAKSKVSINIFSWHRGAITERISNILLNGAVCVSDISSGLTEHFEEDKEIITFKLTDAIHVSEIIKKLLSDDKYRISIAKAGYEKALKNFTWGKRADELIELFSDSDCYTG